MAYYSKKHTPAKNNYKIHNKELLIIIHYLKAWDTELRNIFKGFNIITDHKNIKDFIKKQRLNKRQIRWSQELTRYNYRVKYRQGKKAVLPNTLSRRDQNIPRETNNNRLQARFKQLIPETYIYHSPTQPGSHIHRDNSNYSLPRQRVLQIFEKFADLGENHNNSRTLHIKATNLGNHINRQFLPVTIPLSTITSLTAAESHIHGKDLKYLPFR